MKNKYLYRSTIKFKAKVYSAKVLFEYAKNENIELIDMVQLDEYQYSFEVRYRDFKKIQKKFVDLEIIEYHGPRFILNHLLKRKTSLIALAISLLFFYYLTTLIIGININGTSEKLNQQLLVSLNEKGINRYAQLPSIETLKTLQKELYSEYHEAVEQLEITKSGNFINVTYVRRRTYDPLEERHGKMYAKKDGMIDKIEIGSGVVLVTPNQYVTKGTLLVEDTISLNDNHYVIGTYGKIYAYTWSIVTVEYHHHFEEESEVMSYLINCAQYEVSKDFTDEERIDVQEILFFHNQNYQATLKVHFTLYENIITF